MVGRRLIAMLIDIAILTVFVFLFDGFVSNRIVNATTDILEVTAEYKENSKKYSDIQDEYGIYTYEGDTRTYNENVDETTKNLFLNDARVIALKTVLSNEQNTIMAVFFERVSISIAFGSLIVFIVFPLIVKQGRTVGKLIFKLDIVDSKDKYISWYTCLARYLLYVIMNIYLGLITVGLLPLVNLLISIASENNQTLYDMILHTRVIDGKVPIDIYKQI